MDLRLRSHNPRSVQFAVKTGSGPPYSISLSVCVLNRETARIIAGTYVTVEYETA